MKPGEPVRVALRIIASCVVLSLIPIFLGIWFKLGWTLFLFGWRML